MASCLGEDGILDSETKITFYCDRSDLLIRFFTMKDDFVFCQKASNYQNLVDVMLQNFQALGAMMNIKLHHLFSHLDYFSENLGDVSEEQAEKFHQDIGVIEERYQGRWDSHMMADYWWTLIRVCTKQSHSR